MSNIKHQTFNTEYSTSNIKHRIFNTGIQYRIFNVEHQNTGYLTPEFNTEYSTSNILHSSFFILHSSFPQNVILNINLMPCLLAVGRSR